MKCIYKIHFSCIVLFFFYISKTKRLQPEMHFFIFPAFFLALKKKKRNDSIIDRNKAMTFR